MHFLTFNYFAICSMLVIGAWIGSSSISIVPLYWVCELPAELIADLWFANFADYLIIAMLVIFLAVGFITISHY